MDIKLKKWAYPLHNEVQINECKSDYFFSIIKPSFDIILFKTFWRFEDLRSNYVNLHKSWNNAMSNDGSRIEIIDQAHED